MQLLIWLLPAALLCTEAFRHTSRYHDSPLISASGGTGQRSMRLLGSMKQLKGARKSSRRRPKKTTPAKIYPSPTLYYGNIQDYFGAPREYYALPCADALGVIRSEPMVRLASMIKRGTTAEELSREFELDTTFHKAVKSAVEQLRLIAEGQRCDVTRDLVIYFERVVKRPSEFPHFVDRAHAIKRLQEFWRRREFVRYRGLFKQVYWRMRQIAGKVGYAGVTLQDFRDPALWRRYGVFKGLPRSSMVDNYLVKHKIALNSDIRDFYFIDADTDEVCCILDPEADGRAKRRVDALDPKVMDRIASDLKELGVFPNDEWHTMNMSRVDELQRDCASPDAQRAYAIRDFYLTHSNPGYRVNGDPYYLESFVNHRYRTRTLERDLGLKYENWLRSGAPPPMPRPVGVKYQHMVLWKSLSRNQRRHLVQEFLYPKAQDKPSTVRPTADGEAPNSTPLENT
ncbi:signal peptide-containing protein, putative [Babesia ovata]|uniref:Signal peptide-containing protein, putative n=1 Tax=Babesia ovata TaxID=189622 RepID=A0A2H6KEF9_9APIC|nr:signal peptide-containing protein, putative [Babesia ovata]GBE61364.1 signal peptide-containing protein, putative [Babesia ovata]